MAKRNARPGHKGFYSIPLEERIFDKFVMLDSGRCWPWTAHVGSRGYGTMDVDGATRLAHRVVYELIKGPIPQGMELDHRCHSDSDCRQGKDCPHRRCVNPDHMEPVTTRVNILRSRNPMAENARKTHCVRGHPFSPENTRIRRGTRAGHRVCRLCNAEDQRQYKQRQRAC